MLKRYSDNRLFVTPVFSRISSHFLIFRPSFPKGLRNSNHPLENPLKLSMQIVQVYKTIKQRSLRLKSTFE